MMGLPSLAVLDGAAGPRIWLAAEATDMRCGFDRLAERVQTVIGQSPLSGHLFVFRSRCSSRLKILVWDRDGYLLWYKRLKAGVFKLPRLTPGTPSVELKASELNQATKVSDTQATVEQGSAACCFKACVTSAD
jgi:transposase